MKWQLKLLFLLIQIHAHAAEYFRIELEEISIPGAPAIHSAAIVSYEGKWIVLGGRTNGLHGFNAIDPFSQSGINTQIFVINPANGSVHSVSATSLPISVFEAITTSNMQFYRKDSVLYMIGGYGWNDSAQTFLTSPTLTAINLKGLIAAIENQQINISPFFRQIHDERMAICGAHVEKIDSFYYLVFGHRFDGIYSRIDSSDLFIQQYSYEIRKFKIEDNDSSINITDYTAIRDTINFRRRDYNLVPQIFPDGSYGLTAFSGVFQPGINLPYLNTIDISDTGYYVNNNFNQNLSQYHNAVMPVYDSASNHMHTVFFGGMAMYYRDISSNTIVADSMVPFVNTISRVTRDSTGNMFEYELAEKMPALLGTNAQFILADNVPVFYNKIIHLNQLPDRSHVGYVYGGIQSPEINISDTDPSMSFAVNRIFKVFINKLPPDTTITPSEFLIKEPVNIKIFPNPFTDNFIIEANNHSGQSVQLTLYDFWMNMIRKPVTSDNVSFKKNMTLKHNEPGIYFLEVKSGNYKKYYRLIKL